MFGNIKKVVPLYRVQDRKQRPGPVPGKKTDNETELQQTRNRNVGTYPRRN